MGRSMLPVLPALVSLCLTASLPAVERNDNLSVPTGTFTSFEQEDDLAGWQVIGAGTCGRNPVVAKDGSWSLHWGYRPGDRLRRTGCTALTGDKPWFKLWVYNQVPSTGSLTVRVGAAADLERGLAAFETRFHLGFRGWRALWLNRFEQHMTRPETAGAGAIDAIELVAPPAATGGDLWIDNVELGTGRAFAVTADQQLPSQAPNEDTREYRMLLRNRDPARLEPLSQQDRDDLATIARRVDAFLFPPDLDPGTLPPGDPLRIRHEALLAACKDATAAADRLHLHRDRDGRLVGGPVYGDNDRQTPKFTSFYRDWMRMLADVRLHGNDQTRQRMLDLLEHFNNQGFASGSGAGSLGIGHIRMDGWAFAAFSLRDDLARQGRLMEEIATMKWRSLFGVVYDYDPANLTYSFETDYIRGAMIFHLLSVLMMPDSPEKVLDLRYFVRFAEQVMQPRSGLRGGMKPDHVFFHHDTAYMGAYGSEALNIMAEIHHFLHGTRFALAPSATSAITGALEAYRVSANGHSIHLGLCGRMPDRSDPMPDLVGAYAMMGLDGDRAMGETFLRLWDPNDPRIRATFPNCLNSISYFTTLGQIDLMQKAVRTFTAAGWRPRPDPDGAWVFPYGSYAVLRQNGWMASIRAFSRQALNYEYGIDGYPQNRWGRYVNFGSTLLYNGNGAVGSGIDTAHGWDWSRWPGTTALHLSVDELDGSRHHVYGTEPFVGGVSTTGGIGVFAARVVDPVQDRPLQASKSWFLLGDAIVCLGSGITATDPGHAVETTLFQTVLGDKGDRPCWAGSPTPESRLEWTWNGPSTGGTWIVDPYGNGYTIPEAAGLTLHRGIQASKTHSGAASRGMVAVAWLDHGRQPTAGTYHYAIHPQQPPAVVARRLTQPGYTVLRQDAGAHIVAVAHPSLTAYALFDGHGTVDSGILQEADAPCLVIDRTLDGGSHRLSVSDPDLRMGRTPTYASRAIVPQEVVPSTPRTLILTLRGAWMTPAIEGLQSSHDPVSGRTTLRIDLVDGRTRELDLQPILP